MAAEISPVELPEMLLEAGVACDVSGARVDEISRRVLNQIVARYSRAGFKREFGATLDREARRKPGCSAALLLEHRLRRRIDEADLPDKCLTTRSWGQKGIIFEPAVWLGWDERRSYRKNCARSMAKKEVTLWQGSRA